ncbi:MAG: flagellar hook assembly protein FlgD [Thermodesulfovibrio sp.]|jgi:flagellar basal-body rod modification protein FlgD|uniref:Basal-body rod modification protein FlgD n=2 Tax=Thermodesulfovibrio TaxID=28261 RepID=A0A2J6WM06_9BACT|nr:MAG: hypothetical protein C0186_03835 [Thermodesulfovibrio aggregans]
MADVTSIFNNPLYTVQPKTTGTGNNKIDKEAFLKLLTAQLKYQDPLNPLDNTQFVGQLATFSALEQIINIGDTLNSFISTKTKEDALLVGATLIDKTITTTSSEEFTVKGISYQDGKLKIDVGSKTISLDEIQGIKS